jgi:hypothetical protein
MFLFLFAFQNREIILPDPVFLLYQEHNSLNKFFNSSEQNGCHIPPASTLRNFILCSQSACVPYATQNKQRFFINLCN